MLRALQVNMIKLESKFIEERCAEYKKILQSRNFDFTLSIGPTNKT